MEHTLEKLKQLETVGKLPMHMPGHKRNVTLAPYLKTLGAQLDVTEIYGYDSLHAPSMFLKQAMENAAKTWQADQSFLLVNGSTCGILAGIHALTNRGDTVLVARGSHKSVYHALELCGLHVVYLTQPSTEYGFSAPICPEDVKTALENHPEVKLVILTSPTYEGIISDIAGISDLCHEKEIPILVDEAHGAHLGFHPAFDGGAVAGGADVVIQSLHKTLPSLTQTALAHCNGTRVNCQRFAQSLAIFETSSPSYLLLASIDGCIDLVQQQGEALFADWANHLAWFYKQAQALHCLSVVNGTAYPKDPSKLVISTLHCAIDGVQLKTCLREQYDIELEMAYGEYALAMTGMGDPFAHYEKLLQALLVIDQTLTKLPPKQNLFLQVLPPKALDAFAVAGNKLQCYDVGICNGKISKGYVWAYPPGVPLLVPGEIITDAVLSLCQRLTESGVEVYDTFGYWPEQLAVFEH